MANLVGNRIEMQKRAARTALDNAFRAAGGESDEELRRYSKLKTVHFQELTGEFGMDAVTDYIKNMEARRLQRRGA